MPGLKFHFSTAIAYRNFTGPQSSGFSTICLAPENLAEIDLLMYGIITEFSCAGPRAHTALPRGACQHPDIDIHTHSYRE